MRHLGCVFQDMEPPKSSSILRKSAKILKPIRRVRFTKAALRNATLVKMKYHRLEKVAQGILISVAPTLQNLRIGLRKKQNGKSDLLAKQRGGWLKNILKLKEKVNLPSSHLPRIGVSLHPLKH